MFGYGDKSKFQDTYAYGILRNLGISLLLILLILVGAILVNQLEGIFILILGIPVSVILSGLYNGFILGKNGCPRAAKLNFLLAIAAFLLCGTCIFSISR
jgi:uncharacterized RDD family membrane protein YckC